MTYSYLKLLGLAKCETQGKIQLVLKIYTVYMISSYGSPFVTLSITLHFQTVTLHVLNLCSLALHTQLICI